MSEEIITETQVPDIAALVEFIAKSLVDEPSEVKVAVKADEAGEETTIELSVAKDDMGKVIGKQGRIAKAIRTVVRAASVKAKRNTKLTFCNRTGTHKFCLWIIFVSGCFCARTASRVS